MKNDKTYKKNTITLLNPNAVFPYMTMVLIWDL